MMDPVASSEEFVARWSPYISSADIQLALDVADAMKNKKNLDYFLVISGDESTGRSILHRDIINMSGTESMHLLDRLYYKNTIQRQRVLHTTNQHFNVDAIFDTENLYIFFGNDDKKINAESLLTAYRIADLMRNDKELIGVGSSHQSFTLQNFKYRNLIVITNPFRIPEHATKNIFEKNKNRMKTITLTHKLR